MRELNKLMINGLGGGRFNLFFTFVYVPRSLRLDIPLYLVFVFITKRNYYTSWCGKKEWDESNPSVLASMSYQYTTDSLSRDDILILILRPRVSMLVYVDHFDN